MTAIATRSSAAISLKNVFEEQTIKIKLGNYEQKNLFEHLHRDLCILTFYLLKLCLEYLETILERFSREKMLQNSQENIYAGVSFLIELWTARLQL